MTAYALTHLTIVWSDTIVIYKCQTTSVAHKIVHPISRPTGTTEASQWSRRPVNQARPTALFLSSQEQQCSSRHRRSRKDMRHPTKGPRAPRRGIGGRQPHVDREENKRRPTKAS